MYGCSCWCQSVASFPGRDNSQTRTDSVASKTLFAIFANAMTPPKPKFRNGLFFRTEEIPMRGLALGCTILMRSSQKRITPTLRRCIVCRAQLGQFAKEERNGRSDAKRKQDR